MANKSSLRLLATADVGAFDRVEGREREQQMKWKQQKKGSAASKQTKLLYASGGV